MKQKLKTYPAHSQTNFEKRLEFEVVECDPLEKPTYQEIDTTQLSNYQNYVYQAQSSKFWKCVDFEGFRLPAQGRAKAYCKKWISWGCNNINQHPERKHYAEHELKSCKVANCPLCFESWINRQANRSTKRFVKFVGNKQFNFRHIILSPPQAEAKAQSYDQLKKWLSHALKVANIKTCAIVFHPCRFQDREKSMPYPSPHFHLLVYGKVTNTTEFYNKTQWTIKNKGDMKTEMDIFNCVRYMLSHAGVRPKTHVIRYLGDISYRKLKVEKEVVKHRCPYCDLPLRIFFIKFSYRSEPPPIDYVGLWEPECFSPVEDIDDDTQIPFYQLRENPQDDSDYWQDEIFSFEELLSIKTSSSEIQKRLSNHVILESKLLTAFID